MENPGLTLLLKRASIAESDGRFETAIEVYREALRLAPASAAACVNLAALLGSLGRFEEALPLCKRGAEIDPRSIAAWLNLASTLAELRQLDEAAACFTQALMLAPDNPTLGHDLADCLLLAGRVPEAVRLLRQILARHPRAVAVHSSLLFALNFCSESAAELLSEHARFNETLRIPDRPGPSVTRRPAPLRNTASARTRVGFVSGDLHGHSVAYFLAPLFDHYDRAQFHITCYATGRIADTTTAWLRNRADAWVQSYGITDEALDVRIRSDSIDILVDLGGHTTSGRPALFARRPAPVQISFLGYPTTTGLTAMGFRISDWFVDPLEAHAAGPEQPLRMRDSYFCYRPPAAPDVAPAPLLQTGIVTFGSFNTLPKISDQTLALWAAVLDAVPNARLLIKAQGLSNSVARSRVLARCTSAGMDPKRIELMDWQKDVRTHLDCYGRVDVALDTFPYNGATTTCEALWMGVPVVSLSGETPASRMGLSILHAVGRGEWAVRDSPSFVATCVALVGVPHRLAAQRAALRAGLTASALMDEISYVRAFEGLLKECLAPA